MSIYDEMTLLRDVPPFAQLGRKKLELLAFVSDRLVYSAGETLLKQGDPGDSVYVLVDGLIDVFVDKGTGPSHVRELGRHAFFGEVAILRNIERTATVTAKTDIVVLKISKDVLLKMIEDEPELEARIIDHMAKGGYLFD